MLRLAVFRGGEGVLQVVLHGAVTYLVTGGSRKLWISISKRQEVFRDIHDRVIVSVDAKKTDL